MASTVVAAVFTRVSQMASAIPDQRLSTVKPGTTTPATNTTAPLKSSAPMPMVRTVMGSATLIRRGQTSALRSPMAAAPTMAAVQPATWTPGMTAAPAWSATALMAQTIRIRSAARRPAKTGTGLAGGGEGVGPILIGGGPGS